jgi:hypothetical protein
MYVLWLRHAKIEVVRGLREAGNLRGLLVMDVPYLRDEWMAMAFVRMRLMVTLSSQQFVVSSICTQ